MKEKKKKKSGCTNQYLSVTKGMVKENSHLYFAFPNFSQHLGASKKKYILSISAKAERRQWVLVNELVDLLKAFKVFFVMYMVNSNDSQICHILSSQTYQMFS